MEYKVTFAVNNVIRKHLYTTLVKDRAYAAFNRAVKDNQNSVIFDKRFASDKKVREVVYKIFLIKTHAQDDVRRKIKDENGNHVDEPLLGGRYTVLDDMEIKIEETFWVFGYDPNNDRKTVMEIMSIIYMENINDRFSHKFAISIRNKVIIWNEDVFHMIICKNESDADRLQLKLREISDMKRLSSITFGGVCAKSNTARLYELIMERTGWSYKKSTRSTTRP